MTQLLKQILKFKNHLSRLIISGIAIIFVTILLAAPAFATGVYDIPNLESNTWIVDEAEVVSRLTEGKISSTLEDLAKQTGNEVKIITIRRLDYGETPESFTKALFTKWFSTPSAQANQTLLMIDTLTNGTAIVTGDKIKSVMSDEIATSIASETLLAPLRDGDKYNQAFIDASDRLVAVLSGKPDPGPPEIVEKVNAESTFTKAEDTEKNRSNATAWIIGLLIAATVIPMATYYIYLAIQPSSSGE
ncbi:MAG: YgcG family protein [Calothrix sp. SM1_7_51]|nr:YgcG family protein [Calothrix sp. SM1_7_51]